MRHKLLKVAITLCLTLPTAVLAKETEAENLRREVAAIMKRLDKIEGNSALKIAPSCQKTVKSPPEGKLRVTLSGHINKGVGYFDNGHNNSIQEVDVDLSSSRTDLVAEAKFFDDWVAGAEYMAEFLDNSTRNLTIKGANSASTPLTRICEVYAVYKPWSLKAQLGRGYMASYFIQNHADFISSSSLATDGSKGPSELATAVTFFDNTINTASTGTTGTTTGISIGDVFDPGDGLSRQNRARLTIGPIRGISLSASHNYNVTDNGDVALRYAAEFHKILVAAAIAYDHNNAVSVDLTTGTTNTGYHEVHGSAGFLHPCGFSLMFAGVERNWKWPGAKNGHSWYGKAGYEVWIWEAGKTAFAIYGMNSQNMFFILSQPGSFVGTVGLKHIGEAYGLAAVQHLDRIATELYAIWTNYSYKQKGSGSQSFSDINVMLGGARIKF